MAGLYNGVFAMRDTTTGSIWTHFDGSVLTGPLAGTGIRLELKPLVHTTWDEWRALHPDTLVPIWETGFEDRYRSVDPGTGGLNPRFRSTLLNTDERLPENQLVLGAGVGDSYRAYVLDEFGGALTVIPDVLGGHPIVVFMDPATDFALAYSAVVDDQILDFRAEDGVIRDSSGSAWSITGEAVAGPYSGTRLQFVSSFVTEWYGWAAYYPDTEIYGR